jgi:hypothetical protein
VQLKSLDARIRSSTSCHRSMTCYNVERRNRLDATIAADPNIDVLLWKYVLFRRHSFMTSACADLPLIWLKLYGYSVYFGIIDYFWSRY